MLKWLGVLTLLVTPATAQVFGPGPSDPGLFDTVLNLPPDPDIGDYVLMTGFNGQSTQLNVSDGGSIGYSFEPIGDVEVNITGGNVGARLYGQAGSEINISGGSIGREFATFPGSVANISGGTFGYNTRIGVGSQVKISGGTFSRKFIAGSNSTEFVGGEFKLNGNPFVGVTGLGGSLTGTLADGSPFVFNALADDSLTNVTLTEVPLPAIDSNPIYVDGSFSESLPGLRTGQTLTLLDGGVLRENFAVVDATLLVEGGMIDRGLEIARSVLNMTNGSIGDGSYAVADSEVNITGGSVGNSFASGWSSVLNISGGTTGRFMRVNGEVNISGGNIGERFQADDRSVVNISGGSFGRDFDANYGSTVNITGGTFGPSFATHQASMVTITDGNFGSFSANSDSIVNVSGGTFGYFGANNRSSVNISGGVFENGLVADEDSKVSILGTEFFLDGVPVDLELGVPMLIENPNAQLTGLWIDGTEFEFDLSSSEGSTADLIFIEQATLSLLLVEPGPGDFDGNGHVDGVDFLSWQRGESPLPLSSSDLADWLTHYNDPLFPLGGSIAVPEPSTFLLSVLLVCFCGSARFLVFRTACS